ncbi:hypothetical protein [Bacillus infantis]|uniref:hypothetical protein n=1 Tax=Bacillus infantis TaxID=324767 RepID=UPI001653A802|nr:hypothetical protein [Bacillus infantis]
MLRPHSAQARGGSTPPRGKRSAWNGNQQTKFEAIKIFIKGQSLFLENGKNCMKGRITKKVGRIISFLGRIIEILGRKTLNLGGISRKSCISAPAATKIDGIFQRNSSNAAYIHLFLNQI